MSVIELKYGNTNTYLIKGKDGYILFDTAWAGTFNEFCKAVKKENVSITAIKYIIISHYHPDHMGIAQDIADTGAVIVTFDCQKDYIHFADKIFEKDKKVRYTPIDDNKIMCIGVSESRELLAKVGIDGEIVATPGHSEDSISLVLDSGQMFVGDLNPLYELELHKGTVIHDSWDKLLKMKPEAIYYGHAKTYRVEMYAIVKNIMKLIDKGQSIDMIVKKTGADKNLVEDVMRMYLTHRNVGVRGILDRIEIKGR